MCPRIFDYLYQIKMLLNYYQTFKMCFQLNVIYRFNATLDPGLFYLKIKFMIVLVCCNYNIQLFLYLFQFKKLF